MRRGRLTGIDSDGSKLFFAFSVWLQFKLLAARARPTPSLESGMWLWLLHYSPYPRGLIQKSEAAIDTPSLHFHFPFPFLFLPVLIFLFWTAWPCIVVLFMLFCDFLPSLKHTCSSPGSPAFPKPFPNLPSCILNFPLLFPSLVRIAWVALSLVVVLAGWPSFSCHVTPLFADLITSSLEREGKKLLSVCFGDH